MSTTFTLSFSGSSVATDISSCTLLFSTNLTNIGTIISAVFNYKSSLSSSTTKSIALPTNIELNNIVVPFAFGDYNTYYGSFTIRNAKKSYVFPYTAFYVSAPPGVPTLTSLSTNPPDVSGVYNLNGNTTSSTPDYSQLWVQCNNYNKDLNGNPLGDVYRIDLYVQSSDSSSNLISGQTGIYSYYRKYQAFSGGSYSANSKIIYVPGNVTALVDSSNQYITADFIFDSIKTSSVVYDSSNNRTVITVNNTITTSSTNDNIQICSFLTGNSLNIGLSTFVDTMTGASIPLVEDVNYTFFCEVARLSSFNVASSVNLYNAFYTNKINAPTNLSVSNNNTDDALVLTFTQPSDALANGLHNIDSYILTYGATTTAATFDSTNFSATVLSSAYTGEIINSNVYAVTQIGNSAVRYWSDASAAYITTNYTINNTATTVGFQNPTTIKGKTFQAGYIFGLTASGLKENGQVREYGKTGFFTVGTNGLIMKVNPRTISVTVGKITHNATTPLNKDNFNTTGSSTGTFIPITVTGRIGTYGFSDAALKKCPVSLFLNDISLDSFDLSSNDFDVSGVYTTNTLVTFTIKAYVNYLLDFTSLSYGGVVKFGASLTDVNTNASSTIYLLSNSSSGVYNGTASTKTNAFSYKMQDFPDVVGDASLVNYFYTTRPNQTDFNFVQAKWSITGKDSRNGTVTGSRQRIVYANANNGSNTQDVSSNLLSSIFASNTGSSVSATLETYAPDLNNTVTGNTNLFNSQVLTTNSVTFDGIGAVRNLSFAQNATYSLTPKVVIQFNDPSNAGIDATKFSIDISYSSLTGSTPLTFYPVSLTKNGNGFYSVTTQSTDPSGQFYVPFTFGDGMTVKVTPTDIYGVPGTAATTSFVGTDEVVGLSATVNTPFTESPQITLSFQGGNGSYFIFADGVTDVALTNVASTSASGITKVVLQSTDPSGANYLPFNWGDNLTFTLYTKHLTFGYLGKFATTVVTGINAVSNLAFLDNADVNIVNPYITTTFTAPDNLTTTEQFLITLINTTSPSTVKFTNAPNSTGYRSVSLIPSTDVSGSYKFITQSTNSGAANYFSFNWGDNISMSVQPIDTNNELGIKSTIQLTGAQAVAGFAASVNDALTDLPEVTLTFNNNGVGSANYYASVTDASDVTILSEVIKSKVVGNTTTIKLTNFTADNSFNRVSTFYWGDTLIVRLYQKHTTYVNYFGGVSTATISGKNNVRDLTFVPNDDINNITPYVTVKFKTPDNFSTPYYFITVTNTTTSSVNKYSNAPQNNSYNNLTLFGPDASGNYKFKTQGDASGNKNFLPFTFGQGLQVAVQAVDPSTNILGSVNTITLQSLAAVSGLNTSINNMLSDTQQITLTFTGGNGSYFISVFDVSENYTQVFPSALSTTNGGVTTVVLANSATNPSTNSNHNYLTNFDWGDDLTIKVYNKDLNYSYLGAVATKEIVGAHTVQDLTFVNNEDYNTSKPYINVEFSAADNFQTDYYFITVKNSASPSTPYKFSNAPSYNNFRSLSLTKNNDKYTFKSQSLLDSSSNYLPFVWGDTLQVIVQPVDASTNDLGALKSITLTGTAAVTSIGSSINTPLSDIPEVTVSFVGSNGANYYASVTEGSNVTIFQDLKTKPSINGVTTVVFSSEPSDESENLLSVYDWGETLVVNIYQKDSVYDHYLGAIATTTLTGKTAVTGLTFVPNDDINNVTPYVTVEFKEPSNINTQYYFITVTNVTATKVYKYSNAPLYNDTQNLNVLALDGSGNYKFKTQGDVSGNDNFLPFNFGDNLKLSVQAVDPSTNILGAINTIELSTLSPVSNLSVNINNPLTDIPEITLTFNGGNGDYFVSVFDVSENYTQNFTSVTSTLNNGVTKIVLTNKNSAPNYLRTYDWGDNLQVKIYKKDLNYYLGRVANYSIAGSKAVTNLYFANNDTFNPTNPYFTVVFGTPINIDTNYYFITVTNTTTNAAPYKFCNAPFYAESYKSLSLTGPDPDNSNLFTLKSQSSSNSQPNYYPFSWGDSLTVTVRPVDPSTNELGEINTVSLTGLAGVTEFTNIANTPPFSAPQLTVTFKSDGGNYYIYAKDPLSSTTTIIQNVYAFNYLGINTSVLQSGDPQFYNYLNYDWGNNVDIYLYIKDPTYNGYLSAVNVLQVRGDESVKDLTFISNDSINREYPYIKAKFGKPDGISTNYYLITVTNNTNTEVPMASFCNFENYAVPNLTLTGPDASGNFIFQTQQTDSAANNYFPFSWGDSLKLSVQSIDDSNQLGYYASIVLNESSKVRNLSITSNADMYYDLSRNFYPYINFNFTTPTTGSPEGNAYIAYIKVNNVETTPITFTGNSVLTQSLRSSLPNYLNFNYGDKIDIVVNPIVGTTNRLGAVSSTVTVDAASSVRELAFINNSTLDVANPSISFVFKKPLDSITNYYQVIVQNDTVKENTRMFSNLPGFGAARDPEFSLGLIGPDQSTGFYTFTSQSTDPSGNNYLNFNWGDAMQIYVTELDENGNPGSLSDTGVPVPGLTIPAYNAANCSWIQNADISLNPYLSASLDISGVDVNAVGSVTSYDFVFAVNDASYTHMIVNVANGSILNGAISDSTRYLQPVNGTTTQFTIKTQSTDPNKSNYLPFVWNDKVVLTVYPIVNADSTFSNRLGKASDYTQTTHVGTSAMTVTPVANANYNISAPYITLNATYYPKYFVSITDSSNNFWSFTYDSSGNANPQQTITTIITNNSVVPITLRMRYLNITVSNLNTVTNQLYNQKTITYNGIGSVTPTIIANATKNALNGYLTVQFTTPTYGTVSTQNPYVISVADVNAQTKTVYTTVYNNSQNISDLSNNGTATFTNTAIVDLSTNTFTTQSFDSTKPNYLPFNWGDNYTVTVYPVNTYNYLGVSSSVSVTGIPAVKLTLLDTHTRTNPTVKVNVSGHGVYNTFYNNIVVNKNSSNSVGPLYLTNASLDASNNVTIANGDSCINYSGFNVDDYGQTTGTLGNITSANFIINDEISIDVRAVNSLNHLSASPIIPIATPYYYPVLAKTKTTDENGYDVVVNDISLNGQALILYGFTDVFIDPNNVSSVEVKNWLLRFTVVTNNSHQYNNSNASVSSDASIALELISSDLKTYIPVTDSRYPSILESLRINSLTVSGTPYTVNNRAITSATVTVTYNTTSSSTYRLVANSAQAIMSGQNNFAAEAGFKSA